jgi:hypothetical protein
VAGPLNDAGAAAKICAVMIENGRTCETTIFDGQRLELKAEDVPQAAPARPASRNRRGTSKRAATVEEAPPKKPETTSSISISSMFSRKKEQ